MKPKYNHMYCIAFEVVSNDPNGADVTPDMLQCALMRRMHLLNTTPDRGEWTEAVGVPEDTYPIEEEPAS